ncbi:cobalt-precorrin-6B (C15)-methyltransferase [Enterococcus sp. PF1-24]|uniref:decarboxylating cobalt-precorrin-6B (C(15))-methyltransferase n=1 Tax=unclassified Enterococcus TaxID=2608891 RepID=UPI002476C9C6|nr:MULTISPECIES: decarboxylating cobalt-precorrin-6B (C(15))-methyltransferase [unclassified Enterococcus]MDH6363384.1 cobalt-precorrin-6B (C15)-methyltransferase [Enterococcus sp. PFB1-1]MDH6400315.1 cobalt-precorrin-6B (C15)-methyltransferase [Enterococcus sp. PF1-24]
MKDELFIRGKVPMTKEEVRTISLSKLNLHQAKNFLDIGTGTGSMAVEAALTVPTLQVVAIDNNPEALTLLKANQEKFHLNDIIGIQGKAPADLTSACESGDIPAAYDAIFIGGTGGNMSEILEWSFQHLTDTGRLVLNFILLENALQAIAWLKENNITFDACQLQVGRYTTLGQGHYYKQQNPVIIIECSAEEKRSELF